METSEDRTHIVWRFRGIPFRHSPVNGCIEDACPDEEAKEEHTTSNREQTAVSTCHNYTRSTTKIKEGEASKREETSPADR